ncbi:MAG: LysR family transcriptional regulator [Clostridiales bacterium]|nr:LysR family transcriptional regulator [Clostridiales bacterium]
MTAFKTFIAVCECGGITRAAEALHTVQPTVSNTISEIEKYYNVVLFERIN